MAAALKLAPEVVEETCKEFKEIWPVNYIARDRFHVQEVLTR